MLAPACLLKTRERLSVLNSNTFLRVTSNSSQAVPRGERRRVFLKEWGGMRLWCLELGVQRVRSQTKHAHMSVHGNANIHGRRGGAVNVSVFPSHCTGRLSVKTLCLSEPFGGPSDLGSAMSWKIWLQRFEKDLCWICVSFSDDEAEDWYDCSKSLLLGLFHNDSALGLAFYQSCAKQNTWEICTFMPLWWIISMKWIKITE